MYDNMKELIAVIHIIMEIKFVPPPPQFNLMFFYDLSLFNIFF